MLYKEIKNFKKQKPQIFCTPGHKGKMPRCFPAGLDITELSFSDNLYKPSGIIKEAEERAAEIFGVKEVLFLTSGATQGIFAMLGAFKNKRVMIPRASHKSIFEACQTFGIEPVFEGENTLVSARLIVYPDYYGGTVDIKSIYEDCKKKGIYLLADSAHGAHFGFSEHLPESAARYSDCCVLSAHKTLPALTQGAYLCLNSSSIAEDTKYTYRSLGTTSPSYPIMASLDFAAEYMKTHGAKNFEQLFEAAQNFQKKLPHGISLKKTDDFTRLVLDFSATKTDGFSAEKYLNSVGVFPEFSDYASVIFILSVCDTPAALRRLSRKLAALPQAAEQCKTAPKIPAHGKRVMSFLDAGNSPRELVSISASEGRTAAGEVGFYPPAIPLVLRGEVITREVCDIMDIYKEKLFGISDGKISVVK